MLRQFHHHISSALAAEHMATLATCGPAGVQANLLPCAADGMRVYLLLPSTSDQLMNLELAPEVVVSTAAWTLRGLARICSADECPQALRIWQSPDAPWSTIVEVLARRVTLAHPRGWGASETIDIE